MNVWKILNLARTCGTSKRARFVFILSISLAVAIPLFASASDPATAPSTQTSANPALVEAQKDWAAAIAAWKIGQFDEALAEGQAALALLKSVYGDQDNSQVAEVLTGVGTCLFRMERYD